MNICGCLVHASADTFQSVRSQIEAMDGAEVHAASEDGRLVVVVEDTPTRVASELIMELHQIPGVISVTLTYHHFDDPAANAAPLPATSSQAGDQTNDHI